jgi:hypothetical protein
MGRITAHLDASEEEAESAPIQSNSAPASEEREEDERLEQIAAAEEKTVQRGDCAEAKWQGDKKCWVR